MTDEEIVAWARGAGLGRVLAAYPEEVLAAARLAAAEREALGPVDDPAAEPWTAMGR